MTISRIVVGLSGGKASAWCADYVLRQFPDYRESRRIVLYFNDTKWEHPTLYEFLDSLSEYWNYPITYDSDGRSPEDLMYDLSAIPNNRMPFCSRILKAERLQRFVEDGDAIVFGIGNTKEELKRAERIRNVYREVSRKRKIQLYISFPIIYERVSDSEIDNWLASTGIEEPLLYKLGFSHNNCSGGCVRAGKKSWARLYLLLPEVYKERERAEKEFREYIGKDVHILRDETLESLRKRVDSGEFDKYAALSDIENIKECIGVCSTMN